MTIELLKPHTHAGKHLVVGDRLDLPETSARWLIAQGSAKPAARVTETQPARRDTASRTAPTQGD